jgi:cyclophilin family peptidyl-prolyl cis-trans isomerase
MKRILCFALALATVACSTSSAQAAGTVVVMETSMGTIKIELFDDKAPGTVKNFLSYLDNGHYDGTIFHRVMGKENTENQRDFMIQCGGFTTKKEEKETKAAIKNESDNGLSNERGTLAMARTNRPDSATAQFYINVADNTFLDRANARDKVGYCVFGKVIEGMDVVDKIKAVKTGNSKFKTKAGEAEFENVPTTDVEIKSIKRAK